MSVDARIICASGDTPIMVSGTLVNRTENDVTVHCPDNASVLTQGSKVVLTFDGGNERWTGIVDGLEAVDGGFAVRVVAPNAHAPDKRDYPRLHAGLPIRYRIASGDDASAWTSGNEIAGEWHTPDPYMNFSVSGLRFDVHPGVNDGDLLLVELRIGDHSPTWRTTARVIRVFEGRDTEPDNVAVSFEDLPEDALSALSDLTLQIQESLL
jgi:hypothetical protein